MANHILFFLHGMGEHDSTWHEKGLQVLKSAFKEYELSRVLEFEKQFHIVPLVYNDIFKETRERANADFGAFKTAVLGSIEAADAANKAGVEKELDKYANLIGAGGDNFIWTHILDVILYRFSNTIRMGIDVSVAQQVLDAISTQSHLTWSVLAHSLGTSVAHNTLNSLYNTGFPNAANGPIPPLSPLESRCNTLAMIANVSRVIQRTDAKVFESAVKPGSATAGRLCSYYLNARHKLDPFTIPKPFNPDLWPDPGAFSTERYQHIQPSHIHFEFDNLQQVHDFDHYLANPRVHVPIFRSILGRRIVGPNEYRSAKARFDSEIRSNTIDRARSLLENKLPAQSGNWRSLLAAIKRLLS
jgi:hypothetical protein